VNTAAVEVSKEELKLSNEGLSLVRDQRGQRNGLSIAVKLAKCKKTNTKNAKKMKKGLLQDNTMRCNPFSITRRC